MASALTLDGSARSLSLNTPFYLPTNCDLEIDMAWNAISSNYEMIFGTWGTGFSDDQFYFGKHSAPNGTYTLYKRGSAVRENSSAGEIIVGNYAVLTLERRGDNLRVLKDGVEICAPITFSTGALDNAPIKTFCAGNESGFNANVSVKSVTLKNIDTATTTNLWDATASDHSNTGVQPELLDTVGGNNATGVGFPTDGSAWVDLGGDELLAIDSGSYSLSGNAIGLIHDSKIIAGSGTYSLTGAQTNLIAARKIIADSGSYDLTGTDVVLVYTPGGDGEVLSIDSGAFSLSGSDIGLKAARLVSLNNGSYSLAGQPVILTYNAKTIIDSGGYALTGSNVNIFANRVIIAQNGSYNLTGSTVTLRYSGEITQVIGTVSTSFANDKYSANYKPNSITVNFKG